MKTYAWVVAVLLAGCAGPDAGQSSGASGTSGASASGDGERALNSDVSEAISRGSTQGFSPHSSSPPGR